MIEEEILCDSEEKMEKILQQFSDEMRFVDYFIGKNKTIYNEKRLEYKVIGENIMYERFTDRSRKVMQLSNQEAQRYNHEYIGTEHILLGLIKEGSGVAANVLKNLDMDLRKITLEVEKLIQVGPDHITMGKLPQTPRAKKVVEFSIESARELNHSYVGTEHLLLGLLKEAEGVACQVLTNLGLKLENVKEEILCLLGDNKDKDDSISVLEVEIKNANMYKELAINQQDFVTAAKYRDIVDSLKKKKDVLIKVNTNNLESMNKRIKEIVNSVNTAPDNKVEVVIIKKVLWDELVGLISKL